MKTIALIKQVPNVEAMKVSRSRGEVIETEKRVMNPVDGKALELVLVLKEATGGEVIALTLGEEGAKDVLREALALGADRAIHLCDPAFAGGDAAANVRVLSAAIKKIGGYDLVSVGSFSTVGGTGQTGSRLAEALEIPLISYVRGLRVEGEGVWAVCQSNDESREIKIEAPFLVTVSDRADSPRIPSALRIMQAFRKDITVWGVADLSLSPGEVGREGSMTEVRMTFVPE
ncbi:electron transfer flavoprotein subunit beta/FixA family protein [candidate division KSB1 bacterium]|nr:electron transfer flavoprotein subunit beta/FixA family protein [candidate division KSB1 bacterium]